MRYKGKTAQTTRFLWQGYRLLQEQRDDGSRRSWSYDPASPWSPLAALEQAGDSRSADIYWYHTDLNSAPLEVTDAAGNLCWSGQYDTFGKLQGQTVDGAAQRQGAQYQQPLRYAGQYQDDESGLHYNLFRYYEPEVGRFTTQDPIGLRGGLNLYQYAPNPLMWVDPFGLTNEDVTTFYHAGDIKGAIDPSYGNGLKDFDPAGKGGFYVTTDRAQAERWAQMRTDRNMSITQFDVPNSELAKLNIKTFGSANAEWAEFVTKARAGTLAHSYDAVSGPMLLNLKDFRRGGKPRAGGSQFAIYSDKAATTFNKYKSGCK